MKSAGTVTRKSSAFGSGVWDTAHSYAIITKEPIPKGTTISQGGFLEAVHP